MNAHSQALFWFALAILALRGVYDVCRAAQDLARIGLKLLRACGLVLVTRLDAQSQEPRATLVLAGVPGDPPLQGEGISFEIDATNYLETMSHEEMDRLLSPER